VPSSQVLKDLDREEQEGHRQERLRDEHEEDANSVIA
jgi:hypothetical protein